MLLSRVTRVPISTSALALLSVVCVSPGLAEEQQPAIEPAAVERLRAMTGYTGKLKHFSVDVAHSIKSPQANDESQATSDERRVVVAQPNRLAVSAVGESEGQVLCDGKQLFAYWSSANQYLLSDAPDNIAGILQNEAALLLGAGRTAVQLAAGMSEEKFTSSAEKVSLLEPEPVDGIDCDRIEVSRKQAKLTLWIEQGDRPLLRQMQWEILLDKPGEDSELPSQLMKFTNWNLDAPADAQTFAITLPEEAEQVATFTSQDSDEDGPHPLLGESAPDCELALLDGGSQKLAELKDKQVVVLDFWAIWCGPCLEALPHVDKLAAKFSDRPVSFLAVNLGDTPGDIRKFLEKQPLQLPIALDPKSELGDLFHAGSIPLTLIVDKQGVVQVAHVGYSEDLEQTLSEEIEAVLAGKQLAKEALQAAREARRQGAPIPVGKDAVTAKQVTADELDFNLRTSVQAYKQVGSRDDVWDEAAIAFLTEMARHFSSDKDCKTRTQLIEMAEPLAELGCDDPLVKYCHAAMLQDELQDEASQSRALRLVEQSYHGLVERGYPANRCYSAASRMLRCLKKDRSQHDETDKFLALTEQHALEAILQDNLENNDGRTIYRHLDEFVRSLPLEKRAEFCEAAKAHAAKSPFIVNMLVGEYEVDAAWKARGGGYAPSVSDEGWKGFGEHMKLAREHLEEAWKAAPKRPEAATTLIRIAMATSDSPVREMRTWFDRAVRAQLDYRLAYSHLLFGMMPRWHGSHEQMVEFGVECLETERYDTDVPYQYCEAVWRVMKDTHNPLGNRFAQRPGVYENAQTLCQRYIDRGAVERNIPWWKTVWLGFAYLNQQWDDAARLLDELDSELDADALSRFPLAADTVISGIRINTSPHAQAIAAAFQTADNGQTESAAAALKAILAEKDLHPAIASQLASRLQGLDWTLAFQKREPVTLVSTASLHGWKTLAGNWSQTPDGELRGESDLSGVILECQADLGKRWKLSGEIVHGKSPFNPWDAGILWTVDGQPQFSMMFNPTEQWVAAGPHDELKEHRQPFAPQDRTTKFVLRVEDDTVNVWLNDEQVIENQQIEGLDRSPASRIAIGAKYNWAGSTLTFRNLQIEPIEEAE